MLFSNYFSFSSVAFLLVDSHMKEENHSIHPPVDNRLMGFDLIFEDIKKI